MPTYSVFERGAFAGQQMENNGAPIVTGNAFELTDDAPGWVCTGARVYIDASFLGELENGFTASLWLVQDFSGTPAATGTGTIAWGQWAEVLWDTPVDLPGANVPFYITWQSAGSTSNRLLFKASPGAAAIVSPETPLLQMRSIADGRSYFRPDTGATSKNEAGVLFSVDAIVSDGVADLPPVEPSAVRSGSEVLVTWDAPTGAPDGVSLLRAPGGPYLTDGAGKVWGESGYDPTTVAGAVFLAEGLTGTSYHDTDVTAQGDYTYWLVRTGAGA